MSILDFTCQLKWVSFNMYTHIYFLVIICNDLDLSISLHLQPLARMGATVTGVDALETNIKIARLHAVWISSKSKPLCLMY